jgi:hypothetical protein
VYKVNATGSETVLYGFTGGADGGDPLAGVIGDSAGNLYADRRDQTLRSVKRSYLENRFLLDSRRLFR